MSDPIDGAVRYFHDAAGFGLVESVDHQIYFFYFKDIQLESSRDQYLGPGTSVTCLDAPSMHKDNFLRDNTVIGVQPCVAEQAVMHDDGGEYDTADLQQLIESWQAFDKPIMFKDATFNDIVFSDVDLSRQAAPVLFLDCHFTGKFAFEASTIGADIYFCGSTFHGRFSLKRSRILGDVHLEACDFSGVGGASFRGLECLSLYMDFGVRGPVDMVWLNDATVDRRLVLAGKFPSDIQIWERQEKDAIGSVHSGHINSVYIGHEYYRSQRINQTRIGQTLHLKELFVPGGIKLAAGTSVHELLVERGHYPGLHLDHVEIDTQVKLDQAVFGCGGDSVAVELAESRVGDRFLAAGCRMNGDVVFDASTIDKHCELRDCGFDKPHRLSLYALRTELFTTIPQDQLFYDAPPLFRSPVFKLLQREAPGASEKVFLIHEYAALHRWLGAERKLALEDQAFYRMRCLNEPNTLRRWVFAGIFGWGVRLSNILCAVVGIMLLCAAGYILLHDMTWGRAASYSVETFFKALRGSWQVPEVPLSAFNLLSAAESILGVLFITVLIGAYMRKLLR